MQVGFYYKTFIRPRRPWPLYEKFLRNAAGLGKLDQDHRRTERYEKVHRHVDVLVIGGGEAGLEAAVEAAQAGRDTALVEEGLQLGGSLAWSHDGHPRRQELADAAPGGRRRAVPARLCRRRVRGAAGTGLPGHHHVPVPGRRAGAGHRRDRTAAGLRQQRPARHHARRRCQPAGEPVPDPAGRRGRRGHLGRGGDPWPLSTWPRPASRWSRLPTPARATGGSAAGGRRDRAPDRLLARWRPRAGVRSAA